MDQEPFFRWFLKTFSTREYFQRFLAAWIVLLGAHDAIRFGKIEDSVLVLVGSVIGFYFKESLHSCKERKS
jgi:hypothetical protein